MNNNKKKLSKDQNPYYESSIQKSLKKLISEEWFAGQMYKLFINAVDDSDNALINDIMEQTATDELDDHMKGLIAIAKNFGYDVPSTFAEFEKYASEEDCKVFETFKAHKDAEHYFKLAIESEKRAIAAYQEALADKNIHTCPEIEAVFVNNFYDEVDHLNQFEFLLKTLDANADITLITNHFGE